MDGKYAKLESLREKIAFTLPEVQYADKEGKLRIYTSLCTNLSAQLGQYMRLRRLVILPYLSDLVSKEEDGHDCRLCGGHCSVQHAAHIADMREAHVGLRELMEHLPQVGIAMPPNGNIPYGNMLRSLRTDMLQMEETLNEVLFVEESAMIPMMIDLQKSIGAHE